MRWRSWIWFVVSVACFCGAFYFWRLGDRWAAEKEARSVGSQTNLNVVPATKSPGHTEILPLKLLSRPGNLNYHPTAVATSTNRPSPTAYRLSNTSRPLRELMRSETAILLQNALIETAVSNRVPIPDFLRVKGDPGSYIVQSRGPLDNNFRSALKSAGATIVEYIPNNAYLVRASEASAQQLQANPQTQAVLPYEPYYKLKPSLLSLAVQQRTLPEDAALNLLLFADARGSVLGQLQQLGANVLSEDRSPFGPVVKIKPPTDSLAVLAGLSGVQEIEFAPTRIPANDLSRVTVGVATDAQTPTNYFDLTGSGVVVAVDDTGIDATHPDLAGRVGFDFPISGTDTDGHGTHVAGIIAGDGTQSITVTNAIGSINPGTNGQYRGKAPKARLFSMQFTRSDTYLQEIGARTNALISNNSWTYNVADYDLAAASYDAAVRDSVPEVTGSQSLIYVFPAGNNSGINQVDNSVHNDGSGGNPDTILSPATAKNVITVGASEQFRNITNSTYSCSGGTCVTNQPWQPSTDSSNQVAGFSSCGNVGIGLEGDFGRFKPDVIAPGTFVASTRSGQWDEAAYYNPTNYETTVLPALILTTNAFYSSGIFVPDNAVQLIVSADNINPVGANLQVTLIPPQGGAPITGINQLSVFPDATDDYWTYIVSNGTPQTVIIDLRTVLVTVNNNGNFLDELKTNLNAGLGAYYRYESGTSMAAADVSGTLALMEEFFTQRLHRTNSPALMKAMLINGARSLNSMYDFQVQNNLNIQGWGQIFLPTILQGSLSNMISTPTAPASMFVYDQDTPNALTTGRSQTRKYSISADGQNQPLRITLAWTDPPGSPLASIKLVNDLDLVVTNLDTGDVFFGNDIIAGHDFNAPWNTNLPAAIDVVNNVENVYLGPPLGSNYSVTVIGRRVNVNAVTAHPNDVAQDYALVVSSGDGLVPDALTPQQGLQNVFVTSPNVYNITNQFPYDPNNPISGGLLQHQHVGANTPLLGTNLVPIVGEANAVLTTGMTNQWHFYILSNDFNFTNVSFVTFQPPELSVPRMGVTNYNDPANANRVEADIDLYVSTDPNLTNLSPTALFHADKSVGPGGTEFVVKSNASAGGVYYIGIKSEDQVAAEYSFLGVFSLFPPTSTDTNGNRYLNGMPVPAIIPVGTPPNPKAATVIALDILPTHIRRVVVTNIMTHSMPGNLLGNLSHNQKFAVLNNHTCAIDPNTGTCITLRHQYIYEDNGENNVSFSRPSDGPGSLRDFIGEEGLGVWLLTMVNNFPNGTGEVDRLFVKLEPQNITTNGIAHEIAPFSFFYDSIDVPSDATNLTVCVSGNSLPVDLYVSRDAIPTTTTFDYHLKVNPPGNCLPITIFDSPPLVPGRYYIGVYNGNSSEQDIRILATIYKNPFAIATSVGGGAGPINIKDDAITYAYITNMTHLPVSGLDVALLISDPRISDLAITLISPNGTRILLFENRGGTSTNGLGTLSLTSGGQGVSSFGVTNMTAFYTNNFDNIATGPYTPGSVFGGWSVLSNRAVVYPELPAPWLSNNVLVLENAAVTNTLPTTNSTVYNLSFRVNHAPYLVGTVGWWPFDGDGTDIFGGLDGLLFGNVAFNTSPGKVNQAFFGDGKATRMVVPRAPILDFGQQAGFSLEGWIQPTGSSLVSTGATVMSDGFEGTPGTALGVTAGSYVSGWLVTTGDVDIINFSDPRYPGLPDSGNQYLDINGYEPGAVSTNVTLVPGRAYLLSLAYARNPGSLTPPATVPEATVNLNGLTLMDLMPDYTNSRASLGWLKTSVVFTATAVTSRLDLVSLSPGQFGVLFDSFKLQELFFTNSAVPLMEWADAANPAQPGVQWWLGGLPGTNATPGTLWANFWDTNSQPHAISTVVSSVPNGSWQHVALTYDAATATAKLYVGGHLALAQPITGSNAVPRTTADLYFGYHPDPSTNFVSFEGGLDEFGAYQRALTDCEVAAIAHAGSGGKYGTNVLSCPVVDTVQLINALGSSTYTFTNGLTWTNGPQWEINTISFNNVPGPNLTSIVLSDSDPNTTVDEFVLSGLTTNYIDGLMHFTDDTNIALVPIKFAPAPYAISNFPPTLIFSNDFENAVAGMYATGSQLPGTLANPVYGWTVNNGPVTVISNSLVDAVGTNSVALGRGSIQCAMPTLPGHRYKLEYSVRGPGAVSWWTGDINPLSGRAWDVLGGNDGAFIHQATNAPNGYVQALGSTNALFFPGWIDQSNNLASKIELGDPQNLRLTNSFTIEGWINPSVRNDFVPEQVEYILFRGDSRDCLDPYWFGVERTSPNQLDMVFHIQDANSTDCGIALETANQPIQAGTWQHVAAVFDANVIVTNGTGFTNELRLYLNGQQLLPANNQVYLEDPLNANRLNTEFTARFPFADLDPGYSPGVSIGNASRADNSQPYYGSVDELTVYGRAVTGSEIAAIAANGQIGKADYHVPPRLSLAEVAVLIDDVQNDVGTGDNANWNTHFFTFTANRTNSVVTLQSLLPGTIVDGISLTELPAELSYQPEESLSALNGEDAFGTWTLEIVDDRAGNNGTSVTPVLQNWQLNFVLAPSNPPPVVELFHGIPYTDTLAGHGIQNFIVNVPQWATDATNSLLLATDRALLNIVSVGVLWDPVIQSPSSTASAIVWPPAPIGTTVLTTNNPANPLQVITPGRPYYLTVTNPNPFSITFSYEVTFDIISLTNCQPLSNFVWQAGIPRYFQFDVPTNQIPAGLPPQEVSFLLTGVQSNFTGLGSNVTVVLSEHLPLPDLTHYDYKVSLPSTNNDVIMVVTNTTPFPIQTNRWYVGVFNNALTNVPFIVEACYSTNYPVIIPLTNGVPFVANFTSQFVAPPGPPQWFFFEFQITNSVGGVLFEMYNLSGDADLVLQRDVPPGTPPYFDGSFEVGTAPEQIVVRPSSALSDIRGNWYLGIFNNEATNVAYTLRAVVPTNGLLLSAQPLVVTVTNLPSPKELLLQWNAVIGEYYVVEHADVGLANWTNVHTLQATTPLATAVVTPGGQYRVRQIAVSTIPVPRLNIQLWTNNLVRIYWPATFTGTLQYAFDPAGPWANLGLPVVIEGTNAVVYDIIGSRFKYYRLIP
jgi:subtilisin-like proprotein convertase family protein